MDELRVKLSVEGREALDALLEDDGWEDAGEVVSGALEALVELRVAESQTFSEKMAKRSVQAQAQKILDAVRESESERTVREVILEYVVGESYWSEVVEELAKWPFTFPEDADSRDPFPSRTWGTWQEVELAYYRGWITTAQYWHLSARVRGLGPGVVL